MNISKVDLGWSHVCSAIKLLKSLPLLSVSWPVETDAATIKNIALLFQNRETATRYSTTATFSDHKERTMAFLDLALTLTFAEYGVYAHKVSSKTI